MLAADEYASALTMHFSVWYQSLQSVVALQINQQSLCRLSQQSTVQLQYDNRVRFLLCWAVPDIEFCLRLLCIFALYFTAYGLDPLIFFTLTGIRFPCSGDVTWFLWGTNLISLSFCSAEYSFLQDILHPSHHLLNVLLLILNKLGFSNKKNNAH
jgi:hypothetical protein